MKWPFVSRSRYERELYQLREAYSSSTTDLREKLRDLIQIISQVRFRYHQDEMMLTVGYRFAEHEMNFMSPYQRDELYFHVAQSIAEQIKKEVALKSMTRGGNLA